MRLPLLWCWFALLAASSRVVQVEHMELEPARAQTLRLTERLARLLAPQAEAYPLPRPLPRLKSRIGRAARPLGEADAVPLQVEAEELVAPATLDRRTALTSAAAATLFAHTPAASAVDGVPPSLYVPRASVEGKISPLPPLGQYSRYSDELFTPKGSKAVQLRMSFDFPQQLQQIGRALGGIQFVDGNSGLKIYALRAKLPDGTSLADTPKKWFGDSIFSPQGEIAKEGIDIETYKVAKSTEVESPEGAVQARRRLQLKYTVITPANQRATDRAAFVDIYEYEGYAYMLLASGGSTKWEGGEKERCERIAQSFYVAAIT